MNQWLKIVARIQFQNNSCGALSDLPYFDIFSTSHLLLLLWLWYRYLLVLLLHYILNTLNILNILTILNSLLLNLHLLYKWWEIIGVVRFIALLLIIVPVSWHIIFPRISFVLIILLLRLVHSVVILLGVVELLVLARTKLRIRI